MTESNRDKTTRSGKKVRILRQHRPKSETRFSFSNQKNITTLDFVLKQGRLEPAAIAQHFHMSKVQLAETIGVSREAFQKETRINAPKTRTRVQEMLEVINIISTWAGGPDQAMAWYRAQPIPAFGGRTAEALVKTGKATALRDYLDHIALGGFA